MSATITSGQSNLILNCLIERGNPADSEKYIPMHEGIFRRMPRQASAGGGFASKKNLSYARGLKNFRAGIEANISTLKRGFGLNRCNWKSWEGFKRYVWSSIFAYNLQVTARIRLESAQSQSQSRSLRDNNFGSS